MRTRKMGTAACALPRAQQVCAPTDSFMPATLPPQQLVDALNWRYATKKFDPAKKIPAADWHALEQSLILSPSSIWLQPWKFFVVTDPAMKTQLTAASFRQSQVTDCSHFVAFA